MSSDKNEADVDEELSHMRPVILETLNLARYVKACVDLL